MSKNSHTPSGDEKRNWDNPTSSVGSDLKDDALLDAFEEAWQSGRLPDWREFLAHVPQNRQAEFVPELVRIDIDFRLRRGERPSLGDYGDLTSDLRERITSMFDVRYEQDPDVKRNRWSESSRSDRNLLFGILALQLDFIDKDALIAALRDWTTQKHKPLGKILVERGSLSDSRRGLLEPLVDEHIARHNRDAAESLASLSSVSEVDIDWQLVQDPDIEQSLARRRSVHPPTRAAVAASLTPTASGQRFHLLRLHAEGGLGAVYVANDSELNREVALKKIKAQFVADESSRNRFLLEAEITGGLEHPGIVPIYGLGKYSDGQPFYAMRFIRGDSLKEAIHKFHFKPVQNSLKEARNDKFGNSNLANRQHDINKSILTNSAL